MTQKEILSAIAHYEIAVDMEKNVPLMKGFGPFFIRSFPSKSAKLMKRYARVKQTAFEDLSKLFEEKYGKEIPK